MCLLPKIFRNYQSVEQTAHLNWWVRRFGYISWFQILFEARTMPLLFFISLQIFCFVYFLLLIDEHRRSTNVISFIVSILFFLCDMSCFSQAKFFSNLFLFCSFSRFLGHLSLLIDSASSLMLGNMTHSFIDSSLALYLINVSKRLHYITFELKFVNVDFPNCCFYAWSRTTYYF